MNRLAVLISTAKVHPGSEEAFATWQARHAAAISKFSGFISTDMVPPPSSRPEIPWTIIVNFDSEASLTAWKQSTERGKILGEVVPLIDGGNLGETVSTDGSGAIPGTEVTEVIFSNVRPGMADRYREWAARIRLRKLSIQATEACIFNRQPAGATASGLPFSVTTLPSISKLG